MFYDLLKSRRSIRLYKDLPIEETKIDAIIKAALLSPSSRAIKPWEFIVVKNSDTIEKLSLSKKSGSEFIKNAPIVIAIIGDNNKSDVCVEDCSIAATIIQIACENEGLGSCWIQIRNRESKNGVSSEKYVREVLDIPDNYLVEALISIGIKGQTLPPYPEEELAYNKVHKEKF